MMGKDNHSASHSLVASLIKRFEDLPLNRSVGLQEPFISVAVRLWGHFDHDSRWNTLPFVQLRISANLCRSLCPLCPRLVLGVGVDQTNALRRSFPGRSVCEGDFLDHPEVDQFV